MNKLAFLQRTIFLISSISRLTIWLAVELTLLTTASSCTGRTISCAIVMLPWGYPSLISIDNAAFTGLMLLGVLCTGIAYTFLIFAIKHVAAGKAAIIISLEPVWAIFLLPSGLMNIQNPI